MFLNSFFKKIDMFLHKMIAPKFDQIKMKEVVKKNLWKHSISKEEFEKHSPYYQHMLDIFRICTTTMQQLIDRRNTINAFFILLNMLLVPYILLKLPNPHEHFIMLIYITMMLIILCFIWYKILVSYWQYYLSLLYVSMEIENNFGLNISNTTRSILHGTLNKDGMFISALTFETLIPIVFILIYLIFPIALYFSKI